MTAVVKYLDLLESSFVTELCMNPLQCPLVRSTDTANATLVERDGRFDDEFQVSLLDQDFPFIRLIVK